MRQLAVETDVRYPPYRQIIMPDQATDGTLVYRGEIPDLPGCMAHGDTVEEAQRNLAKAKELYLEVLVEHGQPIPRLTPIAQTSGTSALEGNLKVNFRVIAQGAPA